MKTRELTYDPEPGETLRTPAAAAAEERQVFVADYDWRSRPGDVDHDVMTCQQPICVETRRRILARERGLRKD